MVDADRVTRLTDHVRRDAAELARYGQLGRPLTEPDLDAVKYRFITAIEGCTRIAHHLAADQGWGVAETSADAIRLVARHGVVSSADAESIARAVGFRNVLVHQYADVDDDLVVGQLDRLDDFLRFTSSVASWLSAVGH